MLIGELSLSTLAATFKHLGLLREDQFYSREIFNCEFFYGLIALQGMDLLLANPLDEPLSQLDDIPT